MRLLKTRLRPGIFALLAAFFLAGCAESRPVFRSHEITVCYIEGSKLRCSTDGGVEQEIDLKDAGQYMCLPPESAEKILEGFYASVFVKN